MADNIEFNETTFMAKHVAGKTLKTAAMGAAIGGGLVAAALVAATIFTPVGWIAGLGTMVAGAVGIGPGVLGALGAAAVGGALTGGVAGAAIGAATGISGADEAAAAKKEELLAQLEKGELRQQRRDALAMQNAQMHAAAEAQAASLHVSPPTVPIKGMDSGIHLT